MDEETTAELLGHAADRLAAAKVPSDVADALRQGRMVALTKPTGGVRALVMGDVFRRLVARTLARQFGAAFRTACAPFQYALSTRAGSEAVVRAVQTAIQADPRMTVLSIDGVGAYDHMSRASMLEALRAPAPLTGLLPFASLFYGQASRYTYYARPTRRPPRPALPASPAGRIVCVSGRCLHHILSGAHNSGLASRADVVVPPRQRPGTPWENSRLERSWRRARRASGWAARLEAGSSLRLSWQRSGTSTRSCSPACPRSRTCKVHGCCCCCARRRAATTCCEPFRRA